jgi:hypothetical protein
MWRSVDDVRRSAPHEETEHVTADDKLQPSFAKALHTSMRKVAMAAHELVGQQTDLYRMCNPKQKHLLDAVDGLEGVTDGADATVERAWLWVREVAHATADTVHEMGLSFDNATQFVGHHAIWVGLQALLHNLWRTELALTTRAPMPGARVWPDITKARAERVVFELRSERDQAHRLHCLRLQSHRDQPVAPGPCDSDDAPVWTPLTLSGVEERVDLRLCPWHARTKRVLVDLKKSEHSNGLRNDAARLLPDGLCVGKYANRANHPRLLNKIVLDFDEGKFVHHWQIDDALQEIVALMEFCRECNPVAWDDYARRARAMRKMFVDAVMSSPLSRTPGPAVHWPWLGHGLQLPREARQEAPSAPSSSRSSPPPPCPSPRRPLAGPGVFRAPEQPSRQGRLVVTAGGGEGGGFAPLGKRPRAATAQSGEGRQEEEEEEETVRLTLPEDVVRELQNDLERERAKSAALQREVCRLGLVVESIQEDVREVAKLARRE